MSDNPYTPPSAPVGDRDLERTGATWKAVLFGVTTDLFGTTIAGMVLLVAFSGMLVSQGQAPEDIGPMLLQSNQYLLVSLVVGLSFTVLGGYVAARVANHREYRHAFIVGVIVLIIGEVMVSGDPTGMPLSIRIIGDLLVLPAALLGAHLRRATKLRAQDQVL
jgi:predicted Na+-dependent transporter